MSPQQKCKKCLEWKPATREFFGGTGIGTGSLRGTCRECAKKYSREFEKNNKDKRRARDQKRGATGDNARKGFNLDTKLRLFTKQNGKCVCCYKDIKSPAEGEVDHALPLSRGGLDEEFNRWLAHSQCNREKHNKTLREHWSWRVINGLDTESLETSPLIKLCEYVEREHFKRLPQ